LHSKQNAEANSNGDEAEKAKNLNPFAAEEDDDSDNEDGDGDFTIGDLEAEEEGKGNLPVGMGLQGSDETVDELLGSKNVCIPVNSSDFASADDVASGSWNASGAGRTGFPSMWPFGNHSSKSPTFAVETGDDRNHFRGASADHTEMQSSDSDSDEEAYVREGEFENDGQAGKGMGKRRLSVTTEATRRTSLEDDDEDEEVVHVALAEAHADASHAGTKELGKEKEGEDDGELVEIQHAEGVEGVVGSGK
jgi:hypothetical protein